MEKEKPPKMLFGSLHFADRCGARTRSGGRCQNMPLQLGGRCRMHGGASLRGPAHPRYKEGKYSKYRPIVLADVHALAEQLTAMAGQLDLDSALAGLGLGGVVEALAELQAELDDWRNAGASGTTEGIYEK